MVKRWGKSPPRPWQQGRHGKPHPEQCQIGASRGGWSRISVPDTARRDANAREARVGSLTAVVTRSAEEWSSRGASPGQNPAYRLSAQFLGTKIPAKGAWPAGCTTLCAQGRDKWPARALPEPRLIRRFARPPPVWLLTLPGTRIKGGLQGFHRGPSGFPMQEKRPWRSRPPSRSA